MPSDAAYHRDWYARNRDRILERRTRVAKERNVGLRRQVFEYLLDHSCVDCPESDPVVLTFDHREGEQKLANISDAVRHGWAWERILGEIAKCDVRCANCHARKTAVQCGWYLWL